MIAEGRTLDVITQAETRTPFSSWLGDDYERYTAGTAMLETADRLASRTRSRCSSSSCCSSAGCGR